MLGESRAQSRCICRSTSTIPSAVSTLARAKRNALEYPQTPQRCAGGAQAFAHAQGKAAQNERGEGERGAEVESDGGKQQKSAERASSHAPEDGDFGAGAVGDAAGPGAAQERGDVLNADDQACQRGVHAHAQMHKGGQHGQRQSDGEIADEREVDIPENGSEGTAVGSCGGGWKAGAG